ncbi:MAG: hypothetical protein KF700_02365 [Hyphomonadaceae bacterium]|nr:hypothetical protein [Hyphomonadaceae bacterium]
MPVVLRHHHKLELNRVEYEGAITVAELRALADFQAASPTWLTYDSLNLVLPGANFDSIELAKLDALYDHYKKLFAPLNFVILRRSAWICQSPAAVAHVDHWLGGRDTKAGMSSDVRWFDTFAEAGEWLVLNPAAAASLQSGEGFVDIFRLTASAPARPAEAHA